ncbi:endo-1,4-beta-xylanase [Proteiniphilum saccharofermentans]|uniref:endo-1,4-beta-xylanase n=1 Tax=Proteiniphilum saccharofermentans TaxID=1642647 RepID=UPI00391BFE74
MKKGNNKTVWTFLFICVVMLAGCSTPEKETVALKDAYQGKFLMGAALNVDQIEGRDRAGVEIVKHHFNSITAENCMKSMYLQPKEGEFFFEEADRFVEFGEANGMHMVGHTLIWHSQAPDWFFTDEEGNDVSRDVLIERMRNHITTVVGRYKGRIHGWDVVNEAILEDGTYRNSKFYSIIGEEYIPLAFEFAHEADPDTELYYNDYGMGLEGRRNGVVSMVKSLQEKNIPIHGIGMQGHMGLGYPDINEYEKSIQAYSELGLTVMITEMDIIVLPFPSSDVTAEVSLSYEYQQEMNPYTDGLPEPVATVWEEQYVDFFKLFLKHHDKISRVTLWGVSDATSWRNDWPMQGRMDYPLLFDRDYQPKPVVNELIKLGKEQ